MTKVKPLLKEENDGDGNLFRRTLQLKNFCLKCGIPPLTIHSGRRGGVTAAVDAGIDRFNIKAVGNWSSDIVDSYYCPRRVGVEVIERMIKDPREHEYIQRTLRKSSSIMSRSMSSQRLVQKQV